MPVAWPATDVAANELQSAVRSDSGNDQPSRHRTPPQNHADAARRSRPASKPYSRNIAATRSLSMGVFV